VIPERVERRARWVLDTIGARELGFGDDVPYGAEAWEQVERGERPEGDHLAEAFFHLARVEERNGARDEHDRFRAASSCLDPLDPPLERLRAQLGVEPPRWGGARFRDPTGDLLSARVPPSWLLPPSDERDRKVLP